jgi:hypothetical protein
MEGPLNQARPRRAPRSVLGDVVVDAVRFEAGAGSTRRRRAVTVAAATLMTVLLAVALAWPRPSALAPSVSPASPPAPGTGSPMPPPSPPRPPTPRPSTPDPGSSTPAGGAATYCPPSSAGRIDWPPITEAWSRTATPWNGPGTGPAIPFTADQAVICRYRDRGTLAGWARVTAAATVRTLQNAVNSGTDVVTNNPCLITDVAFVVFTAGSRAAFFFLDLTTCNVWMMPHSVVIPGPLVNDLQTLSSTPARG